VNKCTCNQLEFVHNECEVILSINAFYSKNLKTHKRGKKMGDIPTKGLGQFELNTTERLKASLLDNLKNNKKTKQVIKLNGKSSLVFANLAALTLASCGGGGGGSSAPTAPTFSFASQSFTFDEDTPGTFSISAPTNSSGNVTITVDSIPLVYSHYCRWCLACSRN